MKKVSLEVQITELNHILEQIEYDLKQVKSPQRKRSMEHVSEYWTNILESLNQLQELTVNPSTHQPINPSTNHD